MPLGEGRRESRWCHCPSRQLARDAGRGPRKAAAIAEFGEQLCWRVLLSIRRRA